MPDAYGRARRWAAVAGTTLPPDVLAALPVDAAGTLAGDLLLRGSGDPTLDRPQIEALVDQITAAGVRTVTGSVVGDATRFDAVRTGPTGNGVFDPSSAASSTRSSTSAAGDRRQH